MDCSDTTANCRGSIRTCRYSSKMIVISRPQVLSAHSHAIWKRLVLRHPLQRVHGGVWPGASVSQSCPKPSRKKKPRNGVPPRGSLSGSDQPSGPAVLHVLVPRRKQRTARHIRSDRFPPTPDIMLVRCRRARRRRPVGSRSQARHRPPHPDLLVGPHHSSPSRSAALRGTAQLEWAGCLEWD